jgi:antitoxin HicB
MAINRFSYAVRLKADSKIGFSVTCRDLPALITQGDSRPEALAEAADALDEVLSSYMAQRLQIPAASKARRGEFLVTPPADTAAKVALYTAMRASRLSNVQLARKLGIDEKEVRRLLDPHYGSKLPRIAEAVAALGKRLVVGVEAA